MWEPWIGALEPVKEIPKLFPALCAAGFRRHRPVSPRLV